MFYVTGVYSFTAHALFLYVGQGLLNGHGLLKAYIIRCHEAPGTILRIIQEGVYQTALLLGSLIQNFVDDVCRQFLQHINLVVKIHLFLRIWSKYKVIILIKIILLNNVSIRIK